MTTGDETAAASAAASAGVKRSLDLEHSSSTSTHSDTDGMNILMGLPDGRKSFQIGLVV